jgi:hypothetical protein
VQQSADRLGGVAVAPVLGRKGEADLGLARILGFGMGPQSPISRSLWRRATANWNHSPGVSG